MVATPLWKDHHSTFGSVSDTASGSRSATSFPLATPVLVPCWHTQPTSALCGTPMELPPVFLTTAAPPSSQSSSTRRSSSQAREPCSSRRSTDRHRVAQQLQHSLVAAETTAADIPGTGFAWGTNVAHSGHHSTGTFESVSARRCIILLQQGCMSGVVMALEQLSMLVRISMPWTSRSHTDTPHRRQQSPNMG